MDTIIVGNPKFVFNISIMGSRSWHKMKGHCSYHGTIDSEMIVKKKICLFRSTKAVLESFSYVCLLPKLSNAKNVAEEICSAQIAYIHSPGLPEGLFSNQKSKFG
jgi:hypothetical protein